MNRIDDATLDDLVARARSAPRRRLNLNLHPTLDAAVNRLANAVEPDSYIRPHRHATRWELLLPVRGAFDVIYLDEAGAVTARHRLGGPDGLRALEYPAGTWHSLVSLESGSVFFEVKEGPYQPLSPADSAAWAPAEGDPRVPSMLEFLRTARVGERWAG